jgi:hypothetical protein
LSITTGSFVKVAVGTADPENSMAGDRFADRKIFIVEKFGTRVVKLNPNLTIPGF